MDCGFYGAEVVFLDQLAACSGGRIVSWIIYCWLVWCERKTRFPAENLRSFTSKRTCCRFDERFLLGPSNLTGPSNYPPTSHFLEPCPSLEKKQFLYFHGRTLLPLPPWSVSSRAPSSTPPSHFRLSTHPPLAATHPHRALTNDRRIAMVELRSGPHVRHNNPFYKITESTWNDLFIKKADIFKCLKFHTTILDN